MTAHPEAALMLLATAIYLFDSIVLLNRNEALVSQGFAGRWRVSFGSNRWRISGKEPCLPNIFLPHIAQYRMRWELDAAPGKAPKNFALPLLAPLSALKPFVLLSWACLFGLFPLGLFTHAGVAYIVTVVAVMYVSVSVALVITYRCRNELALTKSQVYGLAFECLACIPLGVNLVRRLARSATQVTQAVDLGAAVGQMELSPRAMGEYQLACAQRIRDEIESEDEGTARMSALQANLARFEKDLVDVGN